MKLLLDTHIWLWWQMSPERIHPEATRTIADSGHTVYLSTVSSWEMAIKIAVGKLQLPKPLGEMLPECLLADDMRTLALQHHHCFELQNLPMHHRDPFDRMLVAQARLEGMSIVTADAMLQRYEVELVMVG
ncbi:MAG: type II toxin-antitoxin system VapC family toxin [Deltaproteobacteria bacterium]|nr:MAG: type II toxin-antitoxin system VapC family toxin [Deltaproteobacteria bacterium]